MIKYIFVFFFFTSFINLHAQTKNIEKILDLNAHVLKIMMTENKNYKVELAEFAAVYYANKIQLPCLETAISTKKAVKLKVSAFSLQILECKFD